MSGESEPRCLEHLQPSPGMRPGPKNWRVEQVFPLQRRPGNEARLTVPLKFWKSAHICRGLRNRRCLRPTPSPPSPDTAAASARHHRKSVEADSAWATARSSQATPPASVPADSTLATTNSSLASSSSTLLPSPHLPLGARA
jgi:hypothetical protein